MDVASSHDVGLTSLYTLSLLEQAKIAPALSSAKRTLALDSQRIQSWLVLSECQSRSSDQLSALSTLRQALTRFPDSLQVSWAYGLALVKNGQYQDAIAPLEDVMYRRSDPSVVFELAKCYFKTQQYSSATELNMMLVERYPSNAIYLRATGESLLALKRIPEAVDKLVAACSLDSTSIETYLLLTGAYQEQGDSSRALVVAATAVSVAPKDAMAWYNLGLLRMKHKQFDSAAKALGRAIALRPSYGEAYFNLALTHEERGFLEDATNAFKRCALVSAQLAPDAYNSLAIMYRRNGQLDEALRAHQQAISLRDTSSVLHISRINSCMEAERCDLAATFIDEALVKFPNQQQVLYTCARCLLRVGDNQRVQQIIERLENTSPDLAVQLKTLLRL